MHQIRNPNTYYDALHESESEDLDHRLAIVSNLCSPPSKEPDAMRQRFCHVICDIIVIGAVSSFAPSVPANAQQRLTEDSPPPHGVDGTSIDIARMPPSRPFPTAPAPLPPPARSPREAAQPRGSFLELLETVEACQPTPKKDGLAQGLT